MAKRRYFSSEDLRQARRQQNNACAARRSEDPVRAQKRREYARQWAAQWRRAHPEAARQTWRRDWRRNRDASHARMARWRAANPDKMTVMHRAWLAAHAPDIRRYKRDRYANDPAYRAVTLLRTRLRTVVRSHMGRKSAATMRLLGCTGGQLLAHIVSKFLPGMSLSDLQTARIHIDHIRPCASFDLSDPEQQRQCFHYINLQPLWAVDNLRKSDKVNGMRTRRCAPLQSRTRAGTLLSPG